MKLKENVTKEQLLELGCRREPYLGYAYCIEQKNSEWTRMIFNVDLKTRLIRCSKNTEDKAKEVLKGLYEED